MIAVGSAQAADASQPAATGIVHTVGAAAQGAARSFWTPARMAAATVASTERQELMLGPVFPASALPAELGQKGPPRGTPDPVSFPGVPTIGALFYTNAGSGHFCTASVVSSTVGSLVATAAHCVYVGGYVANLEFVPGYDDGAAPYGTWAVKQITVAKGWRQGQNPDLDVAFVEVVPPPHSVGPVQAVTGALHLAFGLPDAQHITVIGYNNTDQEPIRCATKSFKFRTGQMEFYCKDFWYGTSGSPWIIGYNGGGGTGTVFGLIGGYEAGGYVSWASYSPALENPALALFRQAEQAAA
jgi:V8-like Glu-specific endopeptidase